MGYEVLARKWRPQQFEDVVGQGHVTQTLRNAIDNSRLAHAYLFVGPRGIGKTSLARIFAKALNCAEGPTGSPCDKCDSCKEITAGNNLDVLEIDGASNNGVDQVRDLRDAVRYAPTRGPFKIYIIDEVHMLSTAAFNALLKTLEEPPPHVKFIFATTEPDKVLATIISRCQRFDLRRIPTNLIMERLLLIADDEGVTVDEDALLAIARGAEGGLRDAESALDQLIAFRGNTIVESDVLAVFGLVSRSVMENFANWIIDGDVQAILTTVADLDESGKDLRRLIMEMIGYFRNLLVCLYVADAANGLDMPESQIVILKDQAKKTNSGRIVRVVEILTEAEGRMRMALSGRTLLETTLIRCARAATVVTLEEILDKVNALRSGDGGGADDVGSGVSPKKAIAGKVPAPVVVEPAKAESVKVAPVEVKPVEVEPVAEQVAENADSEYIAEVPAVQVSGSVDDEVTDELLSMVENWSDIIDRISRIVPLMRSSLVDTLPLSVTRERVLIGCDPGFAEDLANFSQHHNHAIVARVIGDFLKRKMLIEFAEADISNLPAAKRASKKGSKGKKVAPDEAEENQSNVVKNNSKELRDWGKLPAVQETMDTFNGFLMEVRA
ncbi:MAG: DNA polymerase III subunit gamma/tau [Kiritimatiellae bacterium]|nr:DNA polymerase III subunit gamma/tau [Kiritimatiellia bacterium]